MSGPNFAVLAVLVLICVVMVFRRQFGWAVALSALIILAWVNGEFTDKPGVYCCRFTDRAAISTSNNGAGG